MGGDIRNTGFVITAASEIMAIICLCTDISDLKKRLEIIKQQDDIHCHCICSLQGTCCSLSYAINDQPGNNEHNIFQKHNDTGNRKCGVKKRDQQSKKKRIERGHPRSRACIDLERVTETFTFCKCLRYKIVFCPQVLVVVEIEPFNKWWEKG